MTSVRESLNIVGQTVSIRQLAHQRNESFPLSLRNFVGAPLGSLIKHVFVLMLENRSFDHMLGFSGIIGTDPTTGQQTTTDGLQGTESNSFRDTAGIVHTHKVATGAADVIGIGPGHEFLDVFEQLCGPGISEVQEYKNGDPYPDGIFNAGFVSSYANTVAKWFDNRREELRRFNGSLGELNIQPILDKLDKLESEFDHGEVMKCFSPSQLPVLNALAQEFVVCDHWFSSMPGPTEPNRMFSHAASAGAFDESPTKAQIVFAETRPGGGFEFQHGTVYKLLKKAGVKYRVYGGDPFPFAAELKDISILEIRKFEDFADDLKKASFSDVGYVHIEPSYDALNRFEGGNSQHPSGSVAAGERFIKATYEAIRSSPVWEKSLLIITWDEHGGFYDHVIPGKAERTGHRGSKHGFRFDQLGPRVPAVVISPLIRRNLVEHKTFDHTAIIATLCRVFGLPSLGARNGISGGVDHLVQSHVPTETPITLPDVATAAVAAFAPTRLPTEIATRRPDALLTDIPPGNLAALLHSALVQHLEVAPAEQHAAILARVSLLMTHADALAYLKEVEQLVHAKRVTASLVHA